MEAVQQWPAVQLNGLFRQARVQQVLETCDVAGYPFRIHRQRVGRRVYCVCAKRVTQHVDRVGQLWSGPVGAGLRPKRGHEPVPRQCAAPGQAQHGQQGELAPMRGPAGNRVAIRPKEAGRAEQADREHES